MSPELRASFSWASADGANLGSGRTVYGARVSPSASHRAAIEQPSSSHRAAIQPTKLGVSLPASLFYFLPRPCHAVLTQVAQARRKHATKVRSPTHTETGQKKRAAPTESAQCMCPVCGSRACSVSTGHFTLCQGRAWKWKEQVSLPCRLLPSRSVRLHPISIQHYPSVASINRQLFQTSSHRILNLNIAIAIAITNHHHRRHPAARRPPPTAHRPSLAPPSLLPPHTSDLRSIRFSPLGPRPWCDFILHPTEPRFSRLRPSWHGLCSSTATASALNHPGSM
ncbi:hypothetical protein EDB80DRAFT_278206 [Ilyonectria destructans]|nr:hypothetical protein EDB80DRAFT_278206 [Ilyonectria destructans]